MSWDDKGAFILYLYLANCIANALPSPTGTNELYLFIYRFFHLLLLNIRNVVQTSLPNFATETTSIEAGTPNGNTSQNVSRSTSLEITKP